MQIPKSKDPRRIDLDGTILVAHQAEFMPWLGFISKAAMGDVYLILDDTQFKKEYFENRNKIRVHNKKWNWLMIPVKGKDKLPNMLDIEIQGFSWIKKHLKTIQYSYAKAPYFDIIFPEIREIYENIQSDKLADININFIKYAFKKFDINIPVYRVSELKNAGFKIEGEGEDLIFSMTSAVEAKVMVAGKSGKDYLNTSRFENADKQLIFQDFEHPVYNQIHGEFEPYMSFIDLLFNYGDDAVKILPKSSYKI